MSSSSRELFLQRLNDAAGTAKRFSAGSLDVARRHTWPGNIRELKHAIECAFILGERVVDLGTALGFSADLPPRVPQPQHVGDTLCVRFGSRLVDVERWLIEATLQRFAGNKRRAADVLGCSVKTLYNKLGAMPSRRAKPERKRTAMTRVLIADDHALFRAGLRQFLVDALPSVEIGEAASGNEVLTCLQSKCKGWDLLILDINMPDRTGLDILRHVKSGNPATRVLVLSGYPERQYALNVLRAGASGYIAKDAAPEDLLKAVRLVLQGRRYVSESLAELLLLDLDRADKPLHSLLSDREFQIFGKLAAGHGVSEIGRELCLSVKTVSTYRTRILEKMRMKSNADLTSYALRNEIIQ